MRPFWALSLCVLAVVAAETSNDDYHAAETIPLLRCADQQPLATHGMFQNKITQQPAQYWAPSQIDYAAAARNVAELQRLALTLANIEANVLKRLSAGEAQKANSPVLVGNAPSTAVPGGTTAEAQPLTMPVTKIDASFLKPMNNQNTKEGTKDTLPDGTLAPSTAAKVLDAGTTDQGIPTAAALQGRTNEALLGSPTFGGLHHGLGGGLLKPPFGYPHNLHESYYPMGMQHPLHYMPHHPWFMKKYGHPFARTAPEPADEQPSAPAPASPCPTNYLLSCEPSMTPVDCQQ